MMTGLSSKAPPTLSVCPAMAGNEMGKGGTEGTKVTKDPTQLLADARKAGQDAVDAILDLIPEVEHKLPPVYPRIDVDSVFNISSHHTEEALKNVHTQISDLIRTHVAGPECPQCVECPRGSRKSWKDYLWWCLQVARPVGQLLWWNGLDPFRVLLVRLPGFFWSDKKKREKEDADARAQEEKH